MAYDDIFHRSSAKGVEKESWVPSPENIKKLRKERKSTPTKTKALEKKRDVPSTEPLNAWGQDAKTAKGERKRLRREKEFKAYRKNL